MLKTICDRCGKEIHDNDRLDMNNKYTLTHFRHDTPSTRWDLCPECANELQLFLKGAWK